MKKTKTKYKAACTTNTGKNKNTSMGSLGYSLMYS
jgi:hypothetical protein